MTRGRNQAGEVRKKDADYGERIVRDQRRERVDTERKGEAVDVVIIRFLRSRTAAILWLRFGVGGRRGS